MISRLKGIETYVNIHKPVMVAVYFGYDFPFEGN